MEVEEQWKGEELVHPEHCNPKEWAGGPVVVGMGWEYKWQLALNGSQGVLRTRKRGVSIVEEEQHRRRMLMEWKLSQ